MRTEEKAMQEAMGQALDGWATPTGLECKFVRLDEVTPVQDGLEISGYASLFGAVDQGGDVVAPGAYAKSLAALKAAGRQIKMLWQHEPGQPIGVWEEVREDDRGLWVKGRLLSGVEKGREAQALIEAGAIDGLSIGYRTVQARRNEKRQRVLTELDLWEVSLVTFPMLPRARVGSKGEMQPIGHILRDMVAAFEAARAEMARP
jgi:HK97 family phage prohead protease